MQLFTVASDVGEKFGQTVSTSGELVPVPGGNNGLGAVCQGGADPASVPGTKSEQ